MSNLKNYRYAKRQESVTHIQEKNAVNRKYFRMGLHTDYNGQGFKGVITNVFKELKEKLH